VVAAVVVELAVVSAAEVVVTAVAAAVAAAASVLVVAVVPTTESVRQPRHCLHLIRRQIQSEVERSRVKQLTFETSQRSLSNKELSK